MVPSFEKRVRAFAIDTSGVEVNTMCRSETVKRFQKIKIVRKDDTKKFSNVQSLK